MSDWSRFSLAVSLALFSVFPASAMDTVTIKTISTTGWPVQSHIYSSQNNGPWAQLEGMINQNAMTIILEKCDINIRFKAESMDILQLHARKNPDGIKYCLASEILFDDYVPSGLALIVQPDKLGEPAAWRMALGSGQDADEIAGNFSSAFQQALQGNDFGYLAVASSEVAASLRAAGKFDQASPFEALSVQSTLAGILKAQGDASIGPALVAIPGTSKLVMSDEAKMVLEQYQSRKLGLSPDSSEWGKTGWTTMRSLPGGGDVIARKWKLPDDLVAEFDSKAFTGEPEM